METFTATPKSLKSSEYKADLSGASSATMRVFGSNKPKRAPLSERLSEQLREKTVPVQHFKKARPEPVQLGRECRTEFVEQKVSPLTHKRELQHSYQKKLRKLEDQRKREHYSARDDGKPNKYHLQSGIEGVLFELPKLVTNSKVLDVSEDVVFLAYGLAQSRSVMDYTMHCLAFIKRRTGRSILSSIAQAELFTFLTEVVNSPGDLMLQSGEVSFDAAHDYIKFWPRVKSSPLWRKINKVVIYMTSMSLFDNMDGTKALKVENAYYRSRAVFQMDFVHNILDLLLFVTERGYQIMKTGDVSCMFHSGTTYEQWYVKASDLIAKSPFLANPDAHGIDIHTFVADLNKTIDKGEAMYKYACELDKTAKGVLRGTLAQLMNVRARYLNRINAQQTRKAPFAVMIEGHSSIGKTTFANTIHYFYGTLRGKNTSLGSRYTRNPAADRWDGFTSDQWSLLCDDVGFLKPGSIKEPDPTLIEMIRIINSAPFMPDMAALEDKGAAPFKGELVVATTNCPDLHLDTYFAVPLAVARRFPYHIRLRPKKEYTKKKIMLDDTKIPDIEPGTYPDWWDIEIWEPKPVPASQDPKNEFHQTFELVKSPDMKKTKVFAMKDFLPWLAGKITKHCDVQTKVSASELTIQRTSVCMECFLPSGMCKCTKSDKFVPKFDTQAGTEAYDFGDFLSEVAFGVSAFILGHIVDALMVAVILVYGAKATLLGVGQDLLYIFFMRSLVAIQAWLIASIQTSPMFVADATHAAGRWVLGTIVRGGTMLQYGAQEGFTCVRGLVGTGGHLIYQWGATNVCYLMARIWFNHRTMKFLEGTVAFGTQAKLSLKTLGQKVQKALKTPWICYLVVAVLTVALAFFKVFNYTDDPFAMQVELHAVGSPPERKQERESVWKKTDYALSHIDFGRLTASWKALPSGDVDRVLSRNCVRLRFWNKVNWKVVGAIGLGGQIFLTTNHSLPAFDDSLDCQIIRGPAQQGLTGNVAFKLKNCDILRDSKRDLVVVRIRCVPPTKDIRDLFARERLGTYRGRGRYIKRATDGSVSTLAVDAIHSGDYYNSELRATTRMWWGSVVTPTQDGDCGSMLVSDSGSGPVILGLHQLGERGGRTVGSLSVTHEDVMRLSAPWEMFMISDNAPLMDSPSTSAGNLIDLDAKSPLRFVETGNIDAFGSLEGFRSDPKNMVKPSILAEAVAEEGVEITHTAPNLRSWKPKRNTLLELTTVRNDIDVDILDECVSELVADWLAGTPDEWKKELKVYDIYTAVNGAPGVRYVDGLNRSTSAGFPFRKSKKFYLESDVRDDFPEGVKFTKELEDRCQKIIDAYQQKHRSGPVFTAALKQEAITWAKKCADKVRVFMASPADHSVVTRMYLLSFVRVVQMNKYTFECAVGTEAQCVEWDWLHQYLTQHGDDRMIAGDFRGYDKSMQCALILAAFEAIARFHAACGVDDDVVSVIMAIGYDISFPYVDYFGDLVQLFGKNPSGQALTAVLNGIVNSLYMRYVYRIENPAAEVKSFKANVALMTYGDDDIMGVSKRVDFFTHTKIAERLSTIGVTYTMADKEAESVPFINISDCSFLKRKWRFEPVVGAYVCPLEPTSIYKSLSINVRSQVVSPEIQAADTIVSANSEWFWHGKETFDRERARLIRVAEKAGITGLLVDRLPSWVELVDRYRDSSIDFLKHTSRPSFARRNGYVLQVGVEHGCRYCAHALCVFRHDPDRSWYRRCSHCGACRVNEYDSMCPRCNDDDQCTNCAHIGCDVLAHPALDLPPGIVLCHECTYTALARARRDGPENRQWYELVPLVCDMCQSKTDVSRRHTSQGFCVLCDDCDSSRLVQIDASLTSS